LSAIHPEPLFDTGFVLATRKANIFTLLFDISFERALFWHKYAVGTVGGFEGYRGSAPDPPNDFCEVTGSKVKEY